ncbi:P-type DNA transfer ATPase VirB11 [Xanthomonas cassavae CFBP 4642]|uniref:Type IV secretion system protein n=2 Tax=Xanthomonas cassavae TaxID=56450 RepID=A0ABS8HGZ9_9XANT|nr:P-type DNA transfer ATPase VirB11 [Xanthomonas cassavae CFBP 4642]
MEPLRPWMSDSSITEICVNRPGEVFIERESHWERHEEPGLTYAHLESLGTAIARYGNDTLDDAKPILSGILPDGERVQIVRPDACEHGTYSYTIRKPSLSRRNLEDYNRQGFFKHVRPVSTGLTSAERELLELRSTGDTLGFLRRAVQLDKVIVVAGETGSGKTTFMKALMQEIPCDQRLITIEDTPELILPDHPNHVHLFYKSEANEEDGAIVTPASLLKSCLRMKPTRILLAELRSGETYDFLNVAASGHRGSITSVHAGSCDLAFERLALMVLQNRQGRQLPYPVIRRLLHLVVDVVVHITNDTDEGGFGRHITELWYDPDAKRALGKIEA